MKTRIFETKYQDRDFTVVYDLYSDGTTVLQHINLCGYPLDIAEIHGSEVLEEFYSHIMAAMDNNAMSYPEVKAPPINDDLFNMVADITRLHAKFTYGINLKL